MNLITIFLTGLLTGGLTCLAVQGGLLAATLAQREEEKLLEKTKNDNAIPILAFLSTKLIAYTILGLLLGLFGSVFQLSVRTNAIMQVAIAIFMIGTALNILNVHPIFRYFVIQPPRFLTRLIRNQSKSKSIFAPALLGFFTIFIPCGTTQAMMALAIGSASPITGALILFSFILGTSPVFFILGYLATKLDDTLQQKFMRVAAFAIIILALFNLNNGVALLGGWPFGKIAKDITCTVSFCSNGSTTNNSQGTDVPTEATINIQANYYDPGTINVKAGQKITLHLNNQKGSGCIQSFVIPKLGISKVIPIGTSNTIVFDAPTQPGQIPFMCGMGMYRGVINVI